MKRLMTNWQFLFALWLFCLGVVFLLVGNLGGFPGAVIVFVFGVALLGIVRIMDKFAGRYDA